MGVERERNFFPTPHEPNFDHFDQFWVFLLGENNDDDDWDD